MLLALALPMVNVRAQTLTIEQGQMVSVRATLPSNPIKATYSYDFGDSAPYSVIVGGFNAAHIYDKTGDYQLKMATKDLATGKLLTVVRPVQVKKSTRRQVQAKDEATFRSGVSQSNSDVALTNDISLSTAINIAADNIQILGNNHTIKWTGVENASVTAINTTATSDQVVFRNVKFQGLAAASLRPAGTNFALMGCEALQAQYWVLGNAKPSKLLFVDCKSLSLTEQRRYAFWVEGSDWTILNCIVKTSVWEHCLRTNGDYINVQGCDFQNADEPGTAFGKGTYTIHDGDYVWVSNSIARYLGGDSYKDRGGDMATGPIPNAGAQSNYVVMEHNFLTGGAAIAVRAGSNHVRVSDNSTDFKDRSVFVKGGSDGPLPAPTDIIMSNNLVVSIKPPTPVPTPIPVPDPAPAPTPIPPVTQPATQPVIDRAAVKAKIDGLIQELKELQLQFN